MCPLLVHISAEHSRSWRLVAIRSIGQKHDEPAAWLPRTRPLDDQSYWHPVDWIVLPLNVMSRADRFAPLSATTPVG